MQKRYLWLDVLKVFLTFMIVMQHTISYSWTTLSIESMEWKIVNIFFLLSRSAVPLFVMCSGIGMLQKERSILSIWRKNIFLLLRAYVCWMLIYGIREVAISICEGNTNTRVLVNMVLKSILFGQYHTWFIIMLLGLYIITPFLFLIVQKKEYLQYFLVLSVIFTTIIPVIQRFEQLSRLYDVVKNINMNFVVGYTMYFVLGYYIVHYVKVKSMKCTAVLFCILFAAACYVSVLLSFAFGQANQEIFIEFSLITAILCCLIMLLFRQMLDEKENNRLITKIADLSQYGIVIYIVHPLILWTIPKQVGVISILYAILIWGAALVISIVINKIPFINKILYS